MYKTLSTPIQQHIEKIVTDGRGIREIDHFERPNKSMDVLDLHAHLGYLELRKYDGEVFAGLAICNDLQIMSALRHNCTQSYETLDQLETAMVKKRNEIRDTPHELEDHPYFADLRGNVAFREWCAAGNDPWYFLS